MIAHAEARRRGAALREIERYRADLCGRSCAGRSRRSRIRMRMPAGIVPQLTGRAGGRVSSLRKRRANRRNARASIRAAHGRGKGARGAKRAETRLACAGTARS